MAGGMVNEEDPRPREATHVAVIATIVPAIAPFIVAGSITIAGTWRLSRN